jgi:hypothetical protein
LKEILKVWLYRTVKGAWLTIGAMLLLAIFLSGQVNLEWVERSDLEQFQPVYISDGRVYRRGEAYTNCDTSTTGCLLSPHSEWKFVARGGNSVNEVEWVADNATGAACDLDNDNGNGTWSWFRKLPNELGLADTTGKVAEWCWWKFTPTVPVVIRAHFSVFLRWMFIFDPWCQGVDTTKIQSICVGRGTM